MEREVVVTVKVETPRWEGGRRWGQLSVSPKAAKAFGAAHSLGSGSFLSGHWGAAWEGCLQGRREEELELFKNPQSASELPALVRVGRQGSRAPPAEKGHPPPLGRALGDRGEGRGRAQLEVEPSVRFSLLNSSFYQA